MSEPAVGAIKRIATERDRNHLIDLGGLVKVGTERDVDSTTAQPTLGLFGEHSVAQLRATVAVGSTRVAHG